MLGNQKYAFYIHTEQALKILLLCFFFLLVIGVKYESVLVLLFAMALLFPVAFYHHSWSLWLGFDFIVESLPKHTVSRPER